jgi:hypothetical protein
MSRQSVYWSRLLCATMAAVPIVACSSRDAPPTAAAPATLLSAEAQVQAVTIQLPNELAGDTVVTLGGMLQLNAAATDAAGRVVAGVGVRWASADTGVATIGDGGLLHIRHSGLVQLAASAGAVTQLRTFSVVLIDGAAVRDLLEDPLVARLVTGLSPTVGGRVQAALAASAGALHAGAAATLRTLGANVASTLRGAEDPADRAVLAVLELYVHELERALTLSNES